MINFYLTSIIFLILSVFGNVFAQTCLPGVTTLSSQAQINSFPVNNLGCTQVLGDLFIDGADITDLSPLGQIQYVGGRFGISRCGLLNDFTGLNITTVGGALYVNEMALITDLTGLESVTFVNGLVVGDNPNMQSLSGIQNIMTNQRSIAIRFNNVLNNITALSNMSAIGGFLIVTDNPALTSLQGLHNINPFSIDGQGISYPHDLEIANNGMLSMCELPNLCTYLQIAGKINIVSNNAANCNSVAQITSICNLVPSPNVGAKLDGGALEIKSTSGIIFHGEDGNCHRLYYNSNGVFSTQQVVCP